MYFFGTMVYLGKQIKTSNMLRLEGVEEKRSACGACVTKDLHLQLVLVFNIQERPQGPEIEQQLHAY